MIVFPGGVGNPAEPYHVVNLYGLYHEYFHQRWGDNVSEGNFDTTSY